MLVALAVAWACSDHSEPTTPTPELIGVAGAEMVQVSSASLQVTSDPAVFSEELAKIGNENELLVALKDASEPGASLERFQQPDIEGLIGLPQRDASTFRRGRPFAHASRGSRQAVITALEAMDAEVKGGLEAPIIQVRLPDAVRSDAVGLLLRHPNVDYIDANRRWKVAFDGPSRPVPRARSIPDVTGVVWPEGSNLLGRNHTFHSVADGNSITVDAWDYTRGKDEWGERVKIGILDTGFAPNHPDGLGITRLGFVDNYEGCTTEKRVNGTCFPDDDHVGGGTFGICNPEVDPDCCKVDDPDCCDPDDPEDPEECPQTVDAVPSGHGTQMAGLVGATDNGSHTVGVAPEAETISMKISCHTSGCDGDIEDGDVVAAIDWARRNDVDILSMSWTKIGPLSLSLRDMLQGAYVESDILLLSSTGNDEDKDGQYPQAYDFVMGVGGLDSDANSAYNNKKEEIAAFSGGKTLSKPDGSFTYALPDSGMTSASTANVAGIAALVRAANRNMSASDVRERLKNTASKRPDGTRIVSALRAVRPTPMSVQIEGDFLVRDHYTCTWTAEVSNGVPPYTYQWFRDGVAVDPDGDEAVVELGTEEESFALEVRVEDAEGRVKVADEGVSVAQNAPICEGGLGT